MANNRALHVVAAALGLAAAFQVAGAEREPAKRPTVALVLSGGGARGIAHVGVLKVLREQRVPVDIIVATSMGSIVGGAYAAGHTPEEMERLVNGANWDILFSDRPPREDLSFRRKEDDLRLVGKSELGIKSDGLVLPRGAFGSQNLEEFLRTVARPASGVKNLDELPIRFRAIATDLVTGESVALRDVPLSVAMRASMSIPGAFAPTNVDGRLLGDGGLVRNLPVEAARELGADVIIAVNVGTPLLPRETLSSALGVAQQMINILTEQNVSISIGALRAVDTLISPDLRGVSFVDFERGPELIARGEDAARDVVTRLAELSLDPAAYLAWEVRRTRTPPDLERAIAQVIITGAKRTNPEALKREVRDRAGVVPGEPVTNEQLVRASRVLYGGGEFERVDVHTEVREGRKVVVVDVDEKPWGPNYLRLGGSAVADFHTDSRFSLILQHTRTWVNSWGAEWRNELEFGNVRRLTTSFFQPLSPGGPWFVEPVLQTVQSDFDIFTSGNHRTDRVTRAVNGAAVGIGRRLGNTGVARFGFGHEWYRSTPLITSRLEGTTKDDANYAQLGIVFDTLDSASFPRRGHLVSASAASYVYSASRDRVQNYVLQATIPLTIDRLTLLALATAARSRDDRGGFGLGGFLSLSGTPVGAVSGSQAGLLSALAYYRFGELPRGLGRSWYAGISLEAGNAWARRSDIGLRDVRKAASVYLGLDTIIGPLYFGWGHTFGGDSAFYLFLGRPGERGQGQ
jgi:NTE family protein